MTEGHTQTYDCIFKSADHDLLSILIFIHQSLTGIENIFVHTI